MPHLAKQPCGRSRGAYLLLVLTGSYAITWTLTDFFSISLSHLGLVRSEAVIVSSLLSLLLYPPLAMATLAATRPVRLWALLATIGFVLKLVSWGIR